MWLSRALDFLFPPRESERRVRETSLDDLCLRLAPVTVALREPVVALLPYRDPVVRSLILEAKFRGSERAASLLGETLAEFLLGYIEERFPEESVVIVPVPLSKERERSRGYNQVARVCAAALPRLGTAMDATTLARVRHTRAQTELGGAERRTNLDGAFSASAFDPGRTYIVVDDVATTGATLLAAIEALRDAGATNVVGLALAH